MNLGKIVSQVLPPLNKFVGWLVPTDKEHIDLRFWHNGEWRSVSPATSSGGGGTGGDGITEIQTEATSPLNLEVTMAGTLATITGSVDIATGDTYGAVMCNVFHFATGWTPGEFTAQYFNNKWGESAQKSGINGENSPQLFYKVYQPDDSGASADRTLMVGIPYPAPENIVTTDNINNVEYVLCVTSGGHLRRVPVSLFTQE